MQYLSDMSSDESGADILANLGGLLKKTTDAATREDSWLSSAKNLVQSAAAAAQQAVVLTSEQRPNLLFTQKGLRKEPGGQDRISAFLPATTDRFVVPADFQRSPPLAPRPSPRLSDTESDSPSSTGLSDSAFRERSSRRRLPPSRAQGALYQRRPSGQYNAKPGGTDQDELMVFLASQYCTPAQHPDESNMARLLETAQWENVAVVETSPIAVAETCENVYERMVASAFNGCSTPDLVRSSPDGAPANTSSRRSYEEVMWRVHEADALPSPKTVCIGLRSPSKAPGADSKPTGQAGPEVPLRVAEEPASPSSTSAPSFVDMKSGSVECPVVTSLPVPPLLPMEPVPPVAVVESTSPPEAVAKSTSPPEAVVNPTSPPEAVVKSTSPPEAVVNPTSPPEAVVNSTSPPEAVVNPTSPPEAVVKSTSPPKAVVKSTSPPEAVVELSGPSQAVVKRSEPSDSALAPEPNNSCLPTSAVERSDSNIAPDLTNLATEEGASSTAPRKKQRVHAGHARNGPGRTRLESSDMPSQSSPSDTIQPPSPQVRRVQHIVTGSSDSSIPRDLLVSTDREGQQQYWTRLRSEDSARVQSAVDSTSDLDSSVSFFPLAPKPPTPPPPPPDFGSLLVDTKQDSVPEKRSSSASSRHKRKTRGDSRQKAKDGMSDSIESIISQGRKSFLMREKSKERRPKADKACSPLKPSSPSSGSGLDSSFFSSKTEYTKKKTASTSFQGQDQQQDKQLIRLNLSLYASGALFLQWKWNDSLLATLRNIPSLAAFVKPFLDSEKLPCLVLTREGSGSEELKDDYEQFFVDGMTKQLILPHLPSPGNRKHRQIDLLLYVRVALDTHDDGVKSSDPMWTDLELQKWRLVGPHVLGVSCRAACDKHGYLANVKFHEAPPIISVLSSTLDCSQLLEATLPSRVREKTTEKITESMIEVVTPIKDPLSRMKSRVAERRAPATKEPVPEADAFVNDAFPQTKGLEQSVRYQRATKLQRQILESGTLLRDSVWVPQKRTKPTQMSTLNPIPEERPRDFRMTGLQSRTGDSISGHTGYSAHYAPLGGRQRRLVEDSLMSTVAPAENSKRLPTDSTRRSRPDFSTSKAADVKISVQIKEDVSATLRYSPGVGSPEESVSRFLAKHQLKAIFAEGLIALLRQDSPPETVDILDLI